MIYYMFAPLDQHFDSGFGALGDSFARASARLDEDRDHPSAFNDRLPVCYLYRHVLELYLKSCITILHRLFKLPNPSNKHEPMPVVKVGDKWKPIHAVHSIQTLFDHLRVLLRMLSEPLGEICKCDITPPPEAAEWIREIEDTDARSTYFRYAVTSEAADDAAKSAMKQIDPQVLIDDAKSSPSEVCAFVLVDEEGQAVEAFGQDRTALGDVLDALRRAVELFQGIHAAMRAELTGGW